MQILIIDDDSEMRAMLEQTLQRAGYEIVSAPDGREGIKQFRVSPADLVITDLYMPNQEGIETIIKLRKDYPGVRIIAMSGKIPVGAMLSVARKVGAVGVLEKPFFSDQLLDAVSKALGPHMETV